MYKKGGFAPIPPPHEKHENRVSRTESSQWLRGRPSAVAPACGPTPSPRAVLGSLCGVAMFLKCCGPNSIRAGGLDDGRYGSEELSPLRSPQAGVAEERGR